MEYKEQEDVYLVQNDELVTDQPSIGEYLMDIASTLHAAQDTLRTVEVNPDNLSATHQALELVAANLQTALSYIHFYHQTLEEKNELLEEIRGLFKHHLQKSCLGPVG